MPVDPSQVVAPPSEAASTPETKGAPAPPGAWEDLLESSDLDHFCAGWLAILCEQIGGVLGAVLAWRRIDGASPRQLASWPAASNGMLDELVARSLDEARGLAVAGDDAPGRVALSHVVPLPRGASAVVAVEVDRESEADWPAVLRTLQWASGWLEARLRNAVRGGAETLDAGPAADVLDLVAVAIEAPSFEEAAHAVVTELAGALHCDRVSLGLEERGHVRVVALSHSADFGKKMNLLVAIAAAMNEARDQGVALTYPAGAGDALVRREHERLCREHGASAALTVPLRVGEHGSGAITFETAAEAGFDDDARRFAEAVAAALGPLLALRQRDDRPLPMKAVTAAWEQAARLLGPGHLGRKLFAIVVASLTVFFAIAEAEYRISADGVLEGSHRRVVVAPFDGYVQLSDLRAGDLVSAGDELARLDDRDLRLEQLKWASRLAQYERQYDEARATRERAQVRILAAQIEEARAELARIEQRIERTRITAPVDALIVAGDLTQALGAAIGRGDVLFELAPLDRYRVLLEVDEAQIGDVEVGQRGSLLLAAMPDEAIGFEVTKLTPISVAEDGANAFRVEGVLDEGSERLRPGMEGVGKIEIGERNLFWIWTRGLQSWLRLQIWSFWP